MFLSLPLHSLDEEFVVDSERKTVYRTSSSMVSSMGADG